MTSISSVGCAKCPALPKIKVYREEYNRRHIITHMTRAIILILNYQYSTFDIECFELQNFLFDISEVILSCFENIKHFRTFTV